ncbi:hypothetical protein ACFY3U_21730 [Micromonospora sp. NPDC000089]|uniref:hypothetical protein n=1 Tax=unclassified Micromonospora TaxID=2617518 RepID=UPI0036A16FB8
MSVDDLSYLTTKVRMVQVGHPFGHRDRFKEVVPTDLLRRQAETQLGARLVQGSSNL